MRSTCGKSKSLFAFLLYHSLVKLLIDRPSILKERHNFIRKSFGEFLGLYGSFFLFFFLAISQVLMAAIFLDIANNTCNKGFSTFTCMYIRQRRLWCNSYPGQIPQRQAYTLGMMIIIQGEVSTG